MSGHRLQLAVEEAAERELARDRVDVRKPRQVADDRADRAAAAAPGRQEAPRRAGAAHLPRALPGQLEHLPVEQEEPREPELVDQRELLVEPRASPTLQQTVANSVAVVEAVPADLRQLGDGRVGPVREVRVAVAELLGQVEAEAVGELGASLRGARVERAEPLQHLRRRAQDRLPVAAPLTLAAVERGATADRDEHVLEREPARVVRMDVTGRDRLHAEVGGEVAQASRPPDVAPLVRALQLDEEALPAERPREPRRAVRVEQPQPLAHAAGEADEPVVPLLEQREVERGRQQVGLAARQAGSRVGRGEQPAEVRVALPRLDEQRHVHAAREGHLGAGDRAQTEEPGRVRELERAVDAVVVGQRERLVAELGRPCRQLLGLGGTVEERIR